MQHFITKRFSTAQQVAVKPENRQGDRCSSGVIVKSWTSCAHPGCVPGGTQNYLASIICLHTVQSTGDGVLSVNFYVVGPS